MARSSSLPAASCKAGTGRREKNRPQAGNGQAKACPTKVGHALACPSFHGFLPPIPLPGLLWQPVSRAYPNLDALAQAGVCFDRNHCQAAHRQDFPRGNGRSQGLNRRRRGGRGKWRRGRPDHGDSAARGSTQAAGCASATGPGRRSGARGALAAGQEVRRQSRQDASVVPGEAVPQTASTVENGFVRSLLPVRRSSKIDS